MSDGMTIKTTGDVKKQIAQIRALAARGDSEAAHGREDELYVAVLKAVVQQAADPNIRALARAALRSQEIGFARHTA